MICQFINDDKLAFSSRELLHKFKLYPNAYYNYLKNRKAPYNRSMTILGEHKNIFINKTTVHKYMHKELDLHAIAVSGKLNYLKGKKNKVFFNITKSNF